MNPHLNLLSQPILVAECNAQCSLYIKVKAPKFYMSSGLLSFQSTLLWQWCNTTNQSNNTAKVPSWMSIWQIKQDEVPSGVPFQQKNRALHYILSLCPLEGTSPRLVCCKGTPKGTLEETFISYCNYFIINVSRHCAHWCPLRIQLVPLKHPEKTLTPDKMISVAAFKGLLMKSCECFNSV